MIESRRPIHREDNSVAMLSVKDLPFSSEGSYFIQIFIWTVEGVLGISIPCISVIQLFKLKTSC